MKIYILLLSVVMVLAQWITPASIIWNQEKTLQDGKPFKFKTRPVDPTDPFRGKYLTLYFEESRFQRDTLENLLSNEKVFVTLTTDSLGFASIQNLSKIKPTGTTDFLTATVSYSSFYNDEKDSTLRRQDVAIEYPFEQYYIEESKASEAEKMYWDVNSQEGEIAYAVIMVKNGHSAFADFVINGKSIATIIKEINESAD